MFSKVLVANRGEIALRILRTCKRLGIETVVVYSKADENAIYRRLADQAYCIGEGASAHSYLNFRNIIAAAEIADVEAIHPGYGFLAENANFAEVCRDCKIAFIGPGVETMRKFGDKAAARQLAAANDVPVLPGSDGPINEVIDAVDVAREIGYPVILKATAGGGGRGMRLAHNDGRLRAAYAAATAEAEAAFGDGSMYLEKYLQHPRHIEVQILADHHGTVLHLGERDCTIQRRHQKLIEESPSPAIDASRVGRRLRQEITGAAVKLMKKAGYTNAGTVEFLLDSDGSFYFIEVNCRIQVEHPVTEMVTGLDLIEEQLRLASGERLRYRQKDIRIEGHAIECRINAEDPARDFAPRPGRIELYCPPAGRGVRVDTHIYSGYTVPPYYDSLLAKLIVHGKDRPDAIERMRLALDEMILEGPPNTIAFCKDVLGHTQFVEGNFDVNFIKDVMLH